MTDLEPLRERAVVGTVRLEPLIHRDVVAQLVLGVGPAAGAAGAACKINGPGYYSLVAGRLAVAVYAWQRETIDDSPGGDEEGAVGDDHADGGQRDGAQEEEVHQLPLLHVGDAVGGDAARRLARDALGALPAHPQAKPLHWLAQRSAGPAELPLHARTSYVYAKKPYCAIQMQLWWARLNALVKID